MVNLLVRLGINAFALWAASYVVSGVELTGDFINLLIIAAIFGLVNAIIRPIVRLLTLPLTIITFGLFAIVVNTFMLYITKWVTNNLEIENLFAGILASIVISIVSTILSWILKDD